jgi:predicted protein tyrosine phosphatase
MSRIVAALIAGDSVELFGEEVDNLAFAFVAPLRSEYNQVAHCLRGVKPKLAIIA